MMNNIFNLDRFCVEEQLHVPELPSPYCIDQLPHVSTMEPPKPDSEELDLLFQLLFDQDNVVSHRGITPQHDTPLHSDDLAQQLYISSNSPFNEVNDLTSFSNDDFSVFGLRKIKRGSQRKSCKIENCTKKARTLGLCLTHGGGKRCNIDGCNKSVQGGDYCIRHGGGRRCKVEDCDKASQSMGLCKAHGGGSRCKIIGCMKSSQGGGLCRAHGGGKRCRVHGCEKGTQRGEFCATHGGTRLCLREGCNRKDRGGGMCASHGGGKRCEFKGCYKACRKGGFCSEHFKANEE